MIAVLKNLFTQKTKFNQTQHYIKSPLKSGLLLFYAVC
jgi:hypothetical protein